MKRQINSSFSLERCNKINNRKKNSPLHHNFVTCLAWFVVYTSSCALVLNTIRQGIVVNGLVTPSSRINRPIMNHKDHQILRLRSQDTNDETSVNTQYQPSFGLTKTPATRRKVLHQTSAAAIALLSTATATIAPSNAAVGTLPDFAETNAILQGITIQVSEKAQERAMIDFLVESLEFKVLRQRVRSASISEAWLGFGPESPSLGTFEIPQSFGEYGGHASIHVVCDQSGTDVLFRKGDDTSKSNLAYLQVGVPMYRVSKMVENGGDILDAYGIVNVISPSGLPVRAIVGINPDPIMMVAVRCNDVAASKAFYEKLGMVESVYPYCRPNEGKGDFEPPQPKNSVYLSYTPNCMGVLLLPTKKKKDKIPINPAVGRLNVVYTPTTGADDSGEDVPKITDPSGVSIQFRSVDKFENEIKATMAKPATS